ncbi:hypothetical protein K470DRAFT_268470 [Piedraia hortae CBS 480.64]|uniref:Uncharacterized protein n=1 Tax=Piedraia hortae CBS 480.64 TaxID=1314780 RepID=A0A6A7C687_9PEZI|nr:hypothetical protein K470DRAFT_268470 [Piedraia hortae CBS 480.64]
MLVIASILGTNWSNRLAIDYICFAVAMDKFMGIAKGGWHPSNDPAIKRDTWKSDLKNIATGRRPDPYEASRNHESAPLSSLRDPNSFAPPPKRGSDLGRPAIPARPAFTQSESEPSASTPPEPYRMDTTGLRTDHLPKPPMRQSISAVASASSRTPVLPPRQGSFGPKPGLPPRTNSSSPALPPRREQPPPPPPYQQTVTESPQPTADRQPPFGGLSAAKNYVSGVSTSASAPQSENQSANQSAFSGLTSAKKYLSGGSDAATPPGQANKPATPSPSTLASAGKQLSELQQRFSRMGTGKETLPSSTSTSSSSSTLPPAVTQAAASHISGFKKPPPPPPPKRSSLRSETPAEPPPVPLSSKPKFG